MALVDRAADADRHPLVAVDIGNHRQRGRGGDAGIRIARGVGDALLKIADALVRVRVGVRHCEVQLTDIHGIGGLRAGCDVHYLSFVTVTTDGYRVVTIRYGASAERDSVLTGRICFGTDRG
ncbi:yadA -containing domain protein [Burkholderia pseudomallei]|nr:yadA -containing domain protein [Burkholderia pseudomallei]